mgnify:CR=1 FL=1
MKTLLCAILMASVSYSAYAEPHPRRIQYMCASLEELEITLERYQEKLVIATKAPNGRTVNMLYANFETETSSWIIRNLDTDEYCMIGVGDAIHIPESSELNKGTGVGTKTVYK